MSFKLVKNPVFWWPVVVRQPDPAKPGALSEQTFQAEFEAIGAEEARAIRDRLRNLPETEREAQEHALIERVTRNWRDVVDEDGASIPFSAEMFKAAMQASWFRAGLYAAFAEAMNGEARLGN